MEITKNINGQAVAPATISFGKEAFEKMNHTEIRWMRIF